MLVKIEDNQSACDTFSMCTPTLPLHGSVNCLKTFIPTFNTANAKCRMKRKKKKQFFIGKLGYQTNCEDVPLCNEGSFY